MKGFSVTNLKYCRYFYLFYSQYNQISPQVDNDFGFSADVGNQLLENKSNIIRQQVGDEFEDHLIFQIPWRHHIEIFTKCKSVQEALFYVRKTIKNGWSRAMLL